MKKLTELFDEYSNLLENVHINRKMMNERLVKNREMQSKVNELKEEMKQIVTEEMSKGKSLYAICSEEFGKIDKRFHVLFTLVGKK